MSRVKLRAGALGLLAMLLLGLFVATSAQAQGPFFYHRPVGGKGSGVKISAKEPEEVRGGGGEVLLKGEIAGTAVEIAATQVQVKGIIYNDLAQGQAKLEFAYFKPTAVKPTNCNVVIGKNNVIKIVGIQAWTWNGTKAQLEEQPVTAQKPMWNWRGPALQSGVKELPKEPSITTVTLSGALCAAASTTPVTGEIGASIKPALVGEWSTSQTAEVRENGLPDEICWYGPLGIFYYQIENGMLVIRWASQPARLNQTTTLNAFGRQGGAAQEIALFES